MNIEHLISIFNGPGDNRQFFKGTNASSPMLKRNKNKSCLFLSLETNHF